MILKTLNTFFKKTLIFFLKYEYTKQQFTNITNSKYYNVN